MFDNRILYFLGDEEDTFICRFYTWTDKIDCINIDVPTQDVGCSMAQIKDSLVTYEGLLDDFSCLLEYLNKKKKLSDLTYIALHTSDMGDKSVEATNLYNMKFKGDVEYKPENIIWAVKQTSIVDDFNSVLGKYGMEIYELDFSDYVVFLVKKKYFIRTLRLKDYAHVPKEIIDFPIRMKIRKK